MRKLRTKKLLAAAALGLLSVLSSGIALAAPAAVLEVNEEQWYTDNRDTALGGARLTRWFAPLPVFFEGWKSTPRDQIVDYQWDFGDGSTQFHGFNAAHVYETPGSYTCTLTVTDSASATSTATIAITVLPRTGTTYYVDSQLGNDANPGTSPGAGAWKTADKAFSGLTTNSYSPGTTILFTRGQSFDVTAGLVEVAHWKTNSGWMFGAYGAGAKPIIKLKSIAGSLNSIFYVTGVGMAHTTFQDLVFDLMTTAGQRCDFFTHLAEAYDVLFLRVDLKNMSQGITFSGGLTDRRQSGIFIVNSTMYDSTMVENFATSARIALLGNHFDYSGNHVNYLAYCDKGVIAGNIFSRAAFGRAALRIDGEPENTPTNNVQVSDNHIVGWIDPINGYPTVGWDNPASPNYDPKQAHNGGGTRYNFYLLYLAPNARLPQFMQDVVVERNTIINGERFIWMGDYSNLTIRNNTFYTPDTSPDAYRFIIGHEFELRAVQNIYFLNNVVISNENRNGGTPGLFAINHFTAPTSYTLMDGTVVPMTYTGPPTHTNINIKGNKFVMLGQSGGSRYLYFNQDDAALRAQVFTDNNTIYTNTDLNMVQIGGNWQSGGTLSTLAEWKAASGQDATTNTNLFSQTPLAGTPTVPASSTATPIAVSYTGAQDQSGSGLKGVYLWAKKGTSAWAKTALSSTTASGSFDFMDTTGNDTYYFALQAEDNAGHLSAPPAGLGQASTVFGVPDTTAPNPGTAISPASISGDITVSYSGAADDANGSGLAEVRLWVKKGAGGTWLETAQAQAGGSGTFKYTEMQGNDTYYFATRAADIAGNYSPVPTGDGLCSTLYTAPTTDLILYAMFDDTPSDGVLDSSAFGNNGVCPGGTFPTLTTGKAGSAYSFDGVANYAAFNSIAPAIATSQKISICVWINAPAIYTSTTRRGMILSANTNAGGNVMTMSLATATAGDNNTLAIVDGVSSAYEGMTGTIVADGAWHHVAYTSDGTTGKIYVDGVMKSTHHVDFVFSANDQWSAGQEFDGATISDMYQGLMDELKVWNGVLSDADITTVFNGGTPAGGGTPPADTTAPTPGALTAPAAAGASPITISYSGAADAGGSGLKEVHLWAKKGAGAWADTGLLSTAASGSFDYTGMSGNAVYSFDVQAFDVAGNSSATPSGAGQGSTIYDTTAPTAPTISAPATSTSTPITVTYTGAADTGGSGLNSVSLWVKKETAGTWANTGFSQTTASGSFSLPIIAGDGTYFFATVALDNAGNSSAAASGGGQDSTIYSGTVPTAATISAPAAAKAAPIALTYSGASTGASGLKKVSLWVKKATGGTWGDSGLSQTTASGSFNYTGMTGEATYFFATRVQDNGDNLSPAPIGGGSANTMYDTTAPAIGTMTSKTSTRTSPISVSYSGVTDSGSGLKQANLWVKMDAGAWADSGMTLTTGSGTFSYAVTTGVGTYAFSVVAQDNSGNVSATPTGLGLTKTIYDTVKPTKGSTTTAAPKSLNGTVYVSASPIAVSYSGASDSLSGLKLVHLWVKKAPGTWVDTGQSLGTGSGTFDYAGLTTDGTYSFATVAEDDAGNLNDPPVGDGDLTVIYDSSAPAAPTASSAASANTSPIAVTYAGVDDPGSGTKSVKLWTRKNAGAWAATSQTASTVTGSFSYAPAGDGTYYFAVQAANNAGLSSTAPSGSGDTSTIYDTTAPSAGTLTAPAKEDGPPISVTYAGAADGSGSGLKSVYLWFKKGTGGVWANTGLTSAGASGSFFFNGMTGNDTYFFALQAEDNVGNISAAPTGAGGGSTAFDTSFTPGSASSPAYATAGPLTVSYSGAQDTANGGLKLVHLWFKKGAAGTWTDSGLTATGGSGSFQFNTFTGDDWYYFATQAEANNGATTLAVQGNGDTGTIFDTTRPRPATIFPPYQFAKGVPVKITYLGATDDGSGLKTLTLWVKRGLSGVWEKTALTSTTPDGTFDFTDVTGNNQYFFFIQAEDNAGLKTPDPTDMIVFGTTTPGT
ncbi:MAG: PKD domain-containing protein [Candidatus Hydrogenedentes bacterium]|nr:PKD domain-containing protein [Candidatus Hydrogenedentota bacterium]